MATQVLTAVNLFVGGFDLTSDVFTHELTDNIEEVENTVYATTGTTARSFIPGLETFTINHSGYIDPDGTTGPDDVLFTAFKSKALEVATVTPNGSAENALAYTGQRVDSSLTPLTGAVGEMAGFVFSGTGSDVLVRGFMLQSPAAAETANGNSTGLQYAGGVLTGERLYASLHVLAASGTTPTLDVIVQSDTTGFPSPTSQITFTQVTTTLGAQWGTSVAGPITDDFFRVNFTIAGGSPSYTFAVTVGIQ